MMHAYYRLFRRYFAVISPLLLRNQQIIYRKIVGGYRKYSVHITVFLKALYLSIVRNLKSTFSPLQREQVTDSVLLSPVHFYSLRP